MHLKQIKQFFMPVGLTVAFILAIGLPGHVQAAGTASVSAILSKSAVNTNEQFTLDIRVQPNNSIAGIQFNLAYDPSLVTVNRVSEGSLLKQNGANTYFTSGTIDNVKGQVSGVAGVITSPGETVSGSGVLASITMTSGLTRGRSVLALSNVVVGDINGLSLPVSISNSTIDVGAHISLNAIGDKVVNEGQNLSFTISGIDASSHTLSYSASNLPGNATFDNSTHRFSWTPGKGQAGTYNNVRFTVSDGSLTDFKDITITVQTSGTGGSGGTGGGMGGLGILPIPTNLPPGMIDVSSLIGSKGEFSKTVEVISEDKLAKMMIPQNTKGLTTSGEKLTQIGLTATGKTRTSSDDSNILASKVYTIIPERTSFDPAITLTLPYDPGVIPDGLKEESLIVASWNSVLSSWSEISSDVSLGNHTVTAKVADASSFAVIARNYPASFSFNSLSISPESINVGENAIISVLLTNTGSLAGDSEVALKIDGKIIETKMINLGGGDSQTISFKITPDFIGVYKIEIGGLEGRFEVHSSPIATSVSGENGALAMAPANSTSTETNSSDVKPLSNAIPQPTEVKNKPVPTVEREFSLSLLAEIIGVAIVAILVTVGIILLRRQQLLRGN